MRNHFLAEFSEIEEFNKNLTLRCNMVFKRQSLSMVTENVVYACYMLYSYLELMNWNRPYLQGSTTSRTLRALNNMQIFYCDKTTRYRGENPLINLRKSFTTWQHPLCSYTEILSFYRLSVEDWYVFWLSCQHWFTLTICFLPSLTFFETFCSKSIINLPQVWLSEKLVYRLWRAWRRHAHMQYVLMFRLKSVIEIVWK